MVLYKFDISLAEVNMSPGDKVKQDQVRLKLLKISLNWREFSTINAAHCRCSIKMPGESVSLKLKL